MLDIVHHDQQRTPHALFEDNGTKLVHDLGPDVLDVFGFGIAGGRGVPSFGQQPLSVFGRFGGERAAVHQLAEHPERGAPLSGRADRGQQGRPVRDRVISEFVEEFGLPGCDRSADHHAATPAAAASAASDFRMANSSARSAKAIATFLPQEK